MIGTGLLIALGAFMAALVHALIMEGWRTSICAVRHEEIRSADPGTLPSISAIVPARDAAFTIGALLQDLYVQDLSRSNFEAIVVDDHSTDATAAIVQRMMKSWPQLKLIQLEAEQGKKAAISAAAKKALHDLILITDADARCGRSRLSTIAQYWERVKPDLLLMPVATIAGKNPIEQIQRIEQLALQAITAGSASMDAPVLANGANMAFSRSTFFQLNGYASDRFASGDDMFLLQRMKHARKRIGHLLDPKVIVTVHAETSWKAALQQRLRWAGKMRAYRDLKMLVSSIAALLLPWLLLAASSSALEGIQPGEGLMSTLLLLISACLLWLVPIVRLVQAMDRFFSAADPDPQAPGRSAATALLTIPALIAFMIYAPIIAILSIFVRPIWKGRRI